MNKNPRLYRPDDDAFAAEVVPHVATREYNNRNSPTKEGIVQDAGELGVIGETAVCLFFGEDPDRWIQSERKTDNWFLQIAGIKIKAKATRKPDYMIVRQGRVKADVFILVYVRPSDNWPSCLGWATTADILAAPVQDKSSGAYSLPAHWYPRNRNRPLGPLRDRLIAARDQGVILTAADLDDIRPIVTGSAAILDGSVSWAK